MRLILVSGILLTMIVAGIAWRVWDEQAGLAAMSFGAVATLIQLGALALMRPVRALGKAAPFAKYLGRWGAGMGLRFLGVILLALAAGLDRTTFPPAAVALGFLGVLLPLLVLEVRLVR